MPGKWELTRTGSVGRASRDIVAGFTDDLGPGPTEVAKLLVTELVTNAFRHGQGRITLKIRIANGEAYFAVEDEGRGQIAVRPDAGQTGGFGLRFVDELGETWGVEPGCSSVWFTLKTEAD